MSLSEDEIAKKLDKENVLKDLELMLDPVDYKLVALTRESLLKAAAEKVPMLSRLLDRVGDSGESISKIGERVSDLTHTASSQSVSSGFHIGSVAIAAFDFVRIPFIYLSAYVLGQEVPFTLDNNIKWAYSGILMALAITALTVPVAAPIIGFIAASIGISVSTFLLGKTLYERYQLGKEYKKLKKELDSEEEEMRLIQEEVHVLHERLKKATDEQSIIEVYTDIVLLQERYIAQKKIVEKLKTDELHLQQKIEQVGMIHVLDKGVGIALGCLTIVGLSLSLFFPPVGMGILAGTAIAGGVYLLGRLTAPLVQSFGHWLVSKFKKSVEVDSLEQEAVNDNTLTEINEARKGAELDTAQKKLDETNEQHVQKDMPHESTTDVLIGLMGSDIEARKAKHELSHKDEVTIALSNERVTPKPTQEHVNKENADEEEGEGEAITETEGPQHH